MAEGKEATEDREKTFAVRYVGYSLILTTGLYSDSIHTHIEHILERQLGYVEKNKRDKIGILANVTILSDGTAGCNLRICNVSQVAEEEHPSYGARTGARVVDVTVAADKVMTYRRGPSERRAVGFLESYWTVDTHKCHVVLLKTKENAAEFVTALESLLREDDTSLGDTTRRRSAQSFSNSLRSRAGTLLKRSIGRKQGKDVNPRSPLNDFSSTTATTSSSVGGHSHNPSTGTNTSTTEKFPSPSTAKATESSDSPMLSTQLPYEVVGKKKAPPPPVENYFIDDEPRRASMSKTDSGSFDHCQRLAATGVCEPPLTQGSVLRRFSLEDPLARWPAMQSAMDNQVLYPDSVIVGTPGALLIV